MLVFYLLISLFVTTFAIGDEDIRCTANSCTDVECDAIPEKCNATDATSGVFLLSPDICNCCEYCLVYINENEPCSVGDPSNAKHTTICGPGLYCHPDDDSTDGTCQKLTTTCSMEQQNYDKKRTDGTLGGMETRPNCDDDGLYLYYKCIPGQSCHCIHSNGTRIFGEANYNSIENYLSCACSRAYFDAVDVIGRALHPHEHFRCAADGSYDRVQCINEKCLCVDAIDGAPTYPNDDMVDLKHVNNLTLTCYTGKTGQYYKSCEQEYLDIINDIEEKKNITNYSMFVGYKYPNCDLDGTYAAVQQNNTHKYCVDKSNKIITNPIEIAADSVDNMNCKCARALLVMTTAEVPECLDNGNYNPIQCRRGVCRCVDEDGHQVSQSSATCEKPESEKNKLNCNTCVTTTE